MADPEAPRRRHNIENPLVDRTPAELEEDVKRLHDKKLKDVIGFDTLLLGARIARDPYNTDNKAKLNAAESRAIIAERKSEWFYHTKDLRVTILATACAAITQGWQQSTINASSFMMRKELHLHDDVYFGLVNAAPWLSGSIIGTWLSDPLQEGRFGRRPALFIAAIFCTVCVIGSAKCITWKQLLGCRLLLGIGIGTKASVAPVFAAEAAPDRQRGKVLMMWQLFDAFGIFLGYICALLVDEPQTKPVHGGNWRVLLASAMIPPVVLLCLVYMCPESPRFFIRRGEYANAYRSLRLLRGTDIQAARDLYYIHSQLQAETNMWEKQTKPWYEDLIYQDWISKMSFFKRVRYLFSHPRSRRACVVAFTVMLAQQLCGINVLAFYSSALIKSTNAKVVNWFNFAFGLANFLFTFPAYPFIDPRGRRPLLLISLGGMALSLLVVSGCFLIPHRVERIGFVATFTIAVFTLFYSIGAGPIPFTLSAEVFPLCLREVGMSFSVMVNFLGLGILVLVVPVLKSHFGNGHSCTQQNPGSNQRCIAEASLLFVFSAMNVVAFILVFLLVPETNNVQLEEMNSIFNGDHRTKDHALKHIQSLKLDRLFSRGETTADDSAIELSIVNEGTDEQLTREPVQKSAEA